LDIRLLCLPTHDYRGPVHADSGILAQLGLTTRVITGIQIASGTHVSPAGKIHLQNAK